MLTVRIPFTIVSQKSIKEADAALTTEHLFCTLSQNGPYYILTCKGFPDEGAARAFLARARAAFAWLLLEKGVATEPHLDPQRVRYNDEETANKLAKSMGFNDGRPVDAIIDGNMCAIYLSEKNVRTVTAFPVGMAIHMPSEQALRSLIDGTSFPDSDRFSADTKLDVAIALYGAHLTESSPKARFLYLIMALESIAVATTKPAEVVRLLDKWSNEVDQMLTAAMPGSENAHALDALKRELGFRREDSLRSRIRKLVVSTLNSPDAADVAARAVRLYDTRSRLVHDGVIEPKVLEDSIPEAKAIVQRVLSARFIEFVTPKLAHDA